MGADPQILSVLQELVKLLRQPQQQGGASPFAAPVEASALRAVDRRNNKMVPLVRDQASQGLMIWSDWPERFALPAGAGLMSASLADLFTATEDYKDVLIRVTLADTVQRTFEMELIPAGGSAADKYTIFSRGTVLPAGHPGYTLLGFGLRSGDKLHGKCSNANSVAWNVYGLRASGAV